MALYWLFLDSIKQLWVESNWLTAFNRSSQQALPVIISGIEQLGKVSELAKRLQRPWVYYVPFVFLQDGDLDIGDPISHVKTSLQRAKWPYVLKSVAAYCESPWKLSEHYQECSDYRQMKSLNRFCR